MLKEERTLISNLRRWVNRTHTVQLHDKKYLSELIEEDSFIAMARLDSRVANFSLSSRRHVSSSAPAHLFSLKHVLHNLKRGQPRPHVRPETRFEVSLLLPVHTSARCFPNHIFLGRRMCQASTACSKGEEWWGYFFSRRTLHPSPVKDGWKVCFCHRTGWVFRKILCTPAVPFKGVYVYRTYPLWESWAQKRKKNLSYINQPASNKSRY